MESWNYVSRGKVFASNGTTLPSSGAISRSKNAFLNWELSAPSSFSNGILDPTKVTSNDTQDFGGLGFQYMSNQVSSSNTMKDMFCDKIGHGRDNGLNTAMPNAFMGEGESSSKFLSSGLGLNRGDFPLIDLQLGRFGDQGNVQNVTSSNGNGVSISSSFISSSPSKRFRAGGDNAQTAYCQVQGCNKDLSSSKDYHKKHKVCEAHTKTAKVVVNGIEQRFCQQCSRFHLLAEFDDGKRSCRKRLAGHNERRRKPQISVQSGKTTRMLQTGHDSRFQGNVHVKTSFVCPNTLLEGKFSHPEKDIMDIGCRRIKNEDGTGYGTQSASILPSRYLHSKLSLPPFHHGKNYPHLDSGRDNSVASGVLYDGNRYQKEMDVSHSSSLSLFQSASLGSEDFTIYDTASTVPGLSAISDSGCALSLLSSSNSSNQIRRIPIDQSLAMPGGHFQLTASPVSKNLMGSRSQALGGGVSRKTSSSESSCPGGSFISSSETVTFEVSDGLLQGSDFLNAKDNLSGDGTTINLLQLSSQLQQVEHQRQSPNVKPSNDAVFSL